MTESSSTQPTRWGGLGYQQVPGLANRIISRYLRGQRRNMLCFFTERGLLDLAERMRQIRESRQGMMAKNRMFQEVLNQYAERATPKSAPEAAPSPLPVEASVAVQPAALGDGADGNNGDGGGRGIPAGSVPEVARTDGDGIVIEE